jgi:hypothetical protein
METKRTIDQLIFVISLILVPLITYVAAVTLYIVWVMDRMLNPMGFYMPSIVFIVITWAMMVGLLVLVMVKVRQSK